MDANAFSRRLQLQERATAWLDLALSVLALVFLALIVVELTASLSDEWAARLAAAELAIWGIFVVAFVFELTIAPDKARYLRTHWLVALSLAIPALRVFRVANAVRVLRAGRALRALQLARVSAALRRGARALRNLIRISQFGYLLLLSAIVTATIAVAVLYFERTDQGANIRNVGDALWWAAAVVTTVNSPLEPVTFEGRLLALGLRVFGLAVIGYFTARVAVYLLGSAARDSTDERHESALDADVRRLREEVARLTALLEAQMDTAEDRRDDVGRG